MTSELDILDFVGESVIVRALDGRIEAWNAASETLYGHAPSAVTGRLADEVLKTQYPTPLADIEALTLTEGTWRGEVRRTSAAGAELSILAHWSLRRTSDGAPAAIIETGCDITASKKAEEALRYSEQLAGRLAKSNIDCRYNQPGATAISAFSPRALPGFPTAAPVDWVQLQRGVAPGAFTIFQPNGTGRPPP